MKDFDSVEKYKNNKEKALRGDTTALFMLGMACAEHEDSPIYSLKDAFSFFMMAARRGNANAMYQVGHRLLHGIGIEKDSEKAFKWFNAAARGGCIEAYTPLGAMYFKGEGCSESKSEAYIALYKGAKLGSEAAKKNMEKLGWTCD